MLYRVYSLMWVNFNRQFAWSLSEAEWDISLSSEGWLVLVNLAVKVNLGFEFRQKVKSWGEYGCMTLSTNSSLTSDVLKLMIIFRNWKKVVSLSPTTKLAYQNTEITYCRRIRESLGYSLSSFVCFNFFVNTTWWKKMVFPCKYWRSSKLKHFLSCIDIINLMTQDIPGEGEENDDKM